MSTHTKRKAPPDVRVGDVWQEVDPRLIRFVRVLSLYQNGAAIQRCSQDGNLEHGYRQTTALLRRFNGNRSGYKLHHRSDDQQVTP